MLEELAFYLRRRNLPPPDFDELLRAIDDEVGRDACLGIGDAETDVARADKGLACRKRRSRRIGVVDVMEERVARADEEFTAFVVPRDRVVVVIGDSGSAIQHASDARAPFPRRTGDQSLGASALRCHLVATLSLGRS